MGSVIAICSNRFCSFIADSRNILYNSDGSIKSYDDNFQNIIKINSKVLFGAAGMFAEGEASDSPLSVFSDRSDLTAEQVKDACLEYLGQMPGALRKYFICGRTENGILHLYEIVGGKDTAEVKAYELSESSEEIVVLCALPESACTGGEELTYRIRRLIDNSRYHRELLKKIALLFSEISRGDDSIGYHIVTASINR